MGTIKKPVPVKLICGFIFSREEIFCRARDLLERRFGKSDFLSQAIPFDRTDHYAGEMGTGLIRRFCSFRRLIDPWRLAAIKVWTNRIEDKLSSNKRRQVNIDPGYVDLAKLVLATTKDFSHRIPISKGIFGEVTLSYHGNSFEPVEMTYPDYRTREYIGIFNSIRENYRRQAEVLPPKKKLP